MITLLRVVIDGRPQILQVSAGARRATSGPNVVATRFAVYLCELAAAPVIVQPLKPRIEFGVSACSFTAIIGVDRDDIGDVYSLYVSFSSVRLVLARDVRRELCFRCCSFVRKDGLGMAELIRTRQLRPNELLDAALARAAQWNPHVNALSASFPDRARKAIADGLPEGPFQGVPFLLKSLSAPLDGPPITLGSRLFADVVSDHDSTLVERYKRAGLVIFGMTTTPEMGLSASTETSFTGSTRNPRNSKAA